MSPTTTLVQTIDHRTSIARQNTIHAGTTTSARTELDRITANLRANPVVRLTFVGRNAVEYRQHGRITRIAFAHL